MTDKRSGFFTSNKDLLFVVTLGVLVLSIYFQTTGFSFINLDDNLYVYGNEAIKNGLTLQSFQWAFTTFWSANWHPLTWLSHALDIQCFGISPEKHHAINVLFHLINSILAFVVFRKMTGRDWESFIVAALFAAHPTHVESVAWISERKDVLSTMFWLLTMFAYQAYVTKIRDKSEFVQFPQSAFLSYRYWLAVVLYALGLMAKPMLVTLPFVLLLCDYWPLARWNRIRDLFQLILEKLPLFALSAASSVVTFYAQRSGGAVESINGLGIGARLSNTVVSYSKYILMLFYPADLAVLYPLDGNIPPIQLIASILLLASITIVCLWQLSRRPFLIVGWLWFLGTLVPVIGIVQVGSQALADRYTYVPYFGLFIMIVWSVAGLVDGHRVATQTALAVAAISVLVFTGSAWRQTSYWRDNETLYRHALAVTSRNGLIAQNLCHYFMLNDRFEEAEPLCSDAIAITPENPELFNTNGVLLMKLGRFPEAADSFKISIKYSPRYIYAWLNLAQAQALSGQPEDAESSLRSAMEINNGQANDGFAPALSDLAAAYGQQGNYDKAADNYRQLLSLRPNDSAGHASFAKILFFQSKLEDAQQEAQNALQLEPKLAEGWNVLGLVALEKKQNKDAANYFSKALDIKSDFPEAKQNLSRAQSAS